MSKTAEQLVEEFLDSILKQSQAIRSGTARQARYYGNKRAPIARRLLAMGDQAVQQLATLLRHPVRSIRVTAAVYLFHRVPDEVMPVLSEIAKGNDYDAMCARLRIKEWEDHPEHYDPENWAG